MKCPKCGGEMEEGLADAGFGADRGPARWFQGHKYIFFRKNDRQIKVYRCESCGYLESYAK